jgi:hypothetical protein
VFGPTNIAPEPTIPPIQPQLTVGKFCAKFNFDYLEVQWRLEALEKDF